MSDKGREGDVTEAASAQSLAPLHSDGLAEGWVGRRPADVPNKKRPWVGALISLLIIVTFAPLFAGYNFLPFEKYPNWGTAEARNNGRTLPVDKALFARKAVMPWIVDSDFVALSVFWPQDLLAAHSLRQGKLPLWEPYSGCGYPTLENGQYRPFDFFRWPFFLFPTNWMYCFTLFLSLLFGALGALLWLKKEGYAPPEILLGTGVFVLNPWVLERLTIQEPLAYFFLPWLLLTLHQARWKNWRSLALTALFFVALGQVGQPEPCLLVCILAAGHYFFTGLGRGSWRQAAVQRVEVLAFVAVETLAALSVLWWPLFRLSDLSFSYKSVGISILNIYSWKAPLSLASDLFVVPGLGALLVLALLSWKRPMKFWFAVALFGLLVLMPLPGFAHAVKGRLQLWFFNMPVANLKLFFWAGLAFLAPQGLRAVKEGGKKTVSAALFFASLLFAADCWWTWKVPLPLADETRLPVFTLLALVLGGAAILLSRFPRRSLGGLLIPVLILVPMAFPLSLDHLSWNRFAHKENDVVAWLKKHHPHERTMSLGGNFGFVLPPNSGEAENVRTGELNAAYFLNGYFHLFFQAPAPPTLIAYRKPRLLQFRQLGANTILVPNEWSISGLERLYKGSWASAYAIPQAHGRLYFPSHTALYRKDIQLARQILALGKGADDVAVVEPVGQPFPVRWPGKPDRGNLSFQVDRLQRIRILSETSAPALLVLRDSWYPGWRATVDGQPTPIYRVNGCFRGVLVPRGKHIVRFAYRPWIVYISGTVSILVTMLLVLVAFLPKKGAGMATSSA